jgi:foldase protein PrsA
MSKLEFLMPIASRTVAALATSILCLAFAGCSGGGSSGGDVASVNGQKIGRAEYDAKLEALPQAKAVLNQMVQGALIEQYARDNHIDVSDADVQKKEDDIKAKYPPGQFESILKAQNLTEDDVKRILRQQATLEKAVSANIKVSDADIKAYLDKNHATLDTSEQVRARHILVADEKTADMIEAKLKAGGNFADLAKQYSTDPSSKAKGGELGFFSKGQMVAPFQDAAFKQPINAVGPPVKSPFGWHIIQVEERKPAHVATLADTSDKIKTILTTQQQQQQMPTFLAGLRSKANIQIYDDKLKDAIPPAAPPQPSASGAAPAASGAAPAATPADK